MPVKDWFRKMQPMQLYIILVLTIVFFVTELLVSHVTHALTLLMNSYHMLCNIFALAGCIATIKYGQTIESDCDLKKAQSIPSSIGEETKSNELVSLKKTGKAVSRSNQEKKLKNTFGWARIDVVSMLMCCVFLASLCFSIFVEALQTLVHIDHQDEMHHPIAVLCIGAAGLLLNGVCYLLIGGYTFHQGSFLYVTESGDVILSKVVVNDSVSKGQKRLSRTKTVHPPPPKQRQGVWEMCRDVHGCIFVIVCALLVYFIEVEDTAKYIDPGMALLSSATIMVLSYPYMKESCLILLQTIPYTINIDSLKTDLSKHFPDIINIHDFHIWQLTASKVISTVHIIFQDPKVYREIIDDVKEFFHDYGITQVTIQPEFCKEGSSESINSEKILTCLMACLADGCKDSHCCPRYTEPSSKTQSKEVLPEGTPELKSIRVLPDEMPSARSSISTSTTSSSENSENTKLRNEINKSLNDISSLRKEILNEKIENISREISNDTVKSGENSTSENSKNTIPCEH